MTADNYSEQNTLPIRVLITNMSGVLLEIVMRTIQQQPDMTVRHYEKDLVGLAMAVGEQTDVLIIGAPYAYPPPTFCRNLWQTFPRLKIFVLTPSGDPAVMYWLSVRRHHLKTISTEKLVGSIRHVHRLDLITQ
jgi:DNA-binding NarL/FixJ family response regulator